MRAGHSSKQEAWTALCSNISMKLNYPIAACTLTQTECKSIMAPAIQAALPKAGISSTISSIVRNAPNSSGGLEILDLYTHMGTARTSMIVHHCWQNTPTGELLQVAIEDIVVEIGLHSPLWKQPFEKFSRWISPHSFLYHVCQFNQENNIDINIQHKEMGEKTIPL